MLIPFQAHIATFLCQFSKVDSEMQNGHKEKLLIYEILMAALLKQTKQNVRFTYFKE